MIVEKYWETKIYSRIGIGVKEVKMWRGWFLFGIIPLYIKQVGWKER